MSGEDLDAVWRPNQKAEISSSSAATTIKIMGNFFIDFCIQFWHRSWGTACWQNPYGRISLP